LPVKIKKSERLPFLFVNNEAVNDRFDVEDDDGDHFIADRAPVFIGPVGDDVHQESHEHRLLVELGEYADKRFVEIAGFLIALLDKVDVSLELAAQLFEARFRAPAQRLADYLPCKRRK
jgi:hypothetical protein